MVEITKLPPGRAKGSTGVRDWAHERLTGRPSGVWKKPKKKTTKAAKKAKGKKFKADWRKKTMTDKLNARMDREFKNIIG